jgi:two-component system, LuxR family, response regulator FixJ
LNTGTTVFVVDDDPSVRRALMRLLQSVNLACETFPGAQEFLDAYNPAQPGCLLLDIRMPHISGLDLQQMLASRGIEMPIIFITGHGDVPMSVRAMKAGAIDFIQKPFSDQDLLDAIQRALVLDTKLRKDRVRRDDVARRVAALTRREQQVLELVASGMMNKEIASKFGISEKTIKVHRARVMEKMRAGSLAELVLLAQTAGLSTTKVPSESGQ